MDWVIGVFVGLFIVGWVLSMWGQVPQDKRGRWDR
jgi:hypothetical protein